MKLNNSAPLVAAGLLMSTLVPGCSDSYLRSIEGLGGGEQSTIPAGPADAPPSLPGSSLFEDTCLEIFGSGLAPLDAETGDYHRPVLDWMDRTREKFGIDLLQRLSHYEPERIEAVMEEYEEAETDPTIDEAMEHMRELLVERGVTVWWKDSDDTPSLGIVLGDRRSDIDFATKFFNESFEGGWTYPWMILDMQCYITANTYGYKAGIGMNKMAPDEWDSVSWSINPLKFKDNALVTKDFDAPGAFKFLASEADYCLPPGDYLSDSDEDSYRFPDGTTCFDDDTLELNPLETLFYQTTHSRLLRLSEKTKLIINVISDDQSEGRKFFDGSWFAQY